MRVSVTGQRACTQADRYKLCLFKNLRMGDVHTKAFHASAAAARRKRDRQAATTRRAASDVRGARAGCGTRFISWSAQHTQHALFSSTPTSRRNASFSSFMRRGLSLPACVSVEGSVLSSGHRRQAREAGLRALLQHTRNYSHARTTHRTVREPVPPRMLMVMMRGARVSGRLSVGVAHPEHGGVRENNPLSRTCTPTRLQPRRTPSLPLLPHSPTLTEVGALAPRGAPAEVLGGEHGDGGWAAWPGTSAQRRSTDRPV